MRLGGLYAGRRKPRRRALLCRCIGKVQAQLLMSVDCHRCLGLHDLESQGGSGQPEDRARAAVAIREGGAERQSDEVAVKPDGLLETRRAASETDSADQGQFVWPWLGHGIDARTLTIVQVKPQ